MKFWLIVILAVIAVACSSPKPEVMRVPTLAELDGSAVVIDERNTIENARAKALQTYQSLLQSKPNTSTRAEIIRRIADLQVELGERVPLPDVSDAAQREQYKQKVDKHYSQAAGFYRRLLDEYPDSQAAPSVHYQLAKTYEQQGKPDEILATLDQLVESFPNLVGLDEVQFRRAELMFGKDDLSGAEKAYRSVSVFGPASPYYERSLYKRGWALFKQNRFDEGVAEFVRLLDLSLPGKDEGYFEMQQKNLTDRELLADTLRAVSLSMSYLDGPESISRYFSGDNDRIYEDLIYGSLAAHYFAKQRFGDSARAELEFVAQHPESRQAPLFQHRAIEAFEHTSFPEKSMQGKRDYVLLYEARHAEWDITDVTLKLEVLEHLEKYIIELAQTSHALARDEDDPQTMASHYRDAVQWYKKFLIHFRYRENAFEIHFFMAEALFESRRYHEATTEYEQVAYKYPKHPKSAAAAYSALLAYDKRQQQLPPLPSRQEMLDATKAGQGVVRENESLRWKRAGIASARRFFDLYPDHEYAATVLARAANDLYALAELSEAVVVATRLLNLNPPAQAKLRLSAWIALAHSEYEQAHYADSELAYTEALKFLGKQDSRRDGFIELLAESIYRQGEISRDARDYEGAVGHFLRVAQAAPESPVRIAAQYDAASVLLNNGQLERAIDVLNRFRQSFPGHKLQAEVTRNLAVAYLDQGQTIDAAREFGRLGGQSDNPQFRREAKLQSAELYLKGEAREEAAVAYEDYVSLYPEPLDEATELRQKLTDIHLSLGDKKSARKWRLLLVAAEAKGAERRTPRTRFLAAHALLKLAEPVMSAYRSVELVIPLESSLAKKKLHMQKALKIYADAAAYGVQEVSTASTFYTGDIYHSLSQSLLASERPADLSELEAEQYEILLEDEIFPFEEQAIEVHEINATRLPDGVYDEWVKKSLLKLAELLPARYDKTERAELYVQAVQ